MAGMVFDESLFEDDCILPFEMEGREKVFVEDACGRILVVRPPTVDEWHYFNLREQAKLDAEEQEAAYYRNYGVHYDYSRQDYAPYYQQQHQHQQHQHHGGGHHGGGHGSHEKKSHRPRLSIDPKDSPRTLNRRASASPAQYMAPTVEDNELNQYLAAARPDLAPYIQEATELHHEEQAYAYEANYGYNQGYDQGYDQGYGYEQPHGVSPPNYQHGHGHAHGDGYGGSPRQSRSNSTPEPQRRGSAHARPPPKYESDNSSASSESNKKDKHKKHPGSSSKGHGHGKSDGHSKKGHSNPEPQRRYQFDA